LQSNRVAAKRAYQKKKKSITYLETVRVKNIEDE
jgi:hypothetical protein